MNTVTTQNTLPEQDGGLEGYISSWLNTDAKFQYGASYYVPVWALLKNPRPNYQAGLPSTWFIPNNDEFTKALCPPGTPAHDWTGVGPVYEYVFQTMEGGLGNWYGMVAPNAAPKFKIGGTPNCYTTACGSPGWGSQGSEATQANMGTAQLSNTIVFPPDGLTFDTNANGQQLGIAYMPIPMRPKQTFPAPTGDQSWTLFLNAKNFSGPVALFIPNTWSKLSQNYLTIKGRGLDALPAIVDTVAMEIASVPCFEAKDSRGTTYAKIPKVYFPFDQSGKTTLARNIKLYTADAFYNPLKQAFNQGTPLPTSIISNPNTTLSPTCSASPLNFTQGASKMPITNMDDVVQTFATQNEPCTFGLQWTNAQAAGTLPEYYKQVGANRVAIKPSDVPPETNLAAQSFSPAQSENSYTVPAIARNKYWNNWVANQPPVSVDLNDGSTIVYRWYKFVKQPSIAILNLSDTQQRALQKKVEQLHRSWATHTNFIAPPSAGELVNIDPGLLVKPPDNLKIGYVPIVISQTLTNKTATAKNQTTPEARLQKLDEDSAKEKSRAQTTLKLR